MIIKSILEFKTSEIEAFTCGNIDLDDYLKKHALINDINGYGKTYILVDDDIIKGYFTLCSASIKYEEFPLNPKIRIPRYPIPAIRIARLAVLKNEQGKGIGKELIKQAFLRILSVSSKVGVRLVVDDAKESSASFYEKYGFQRLVSDKLSYFMLLDTIEEAISSVKK